MYSLLETSTWGGGALQTNVLSSANRHLKEISEQTFEGNSNFTLFWKKGVLFRSTGQCLGYEFEEHNEGLI